MHFLTSTLLAGTALSACASSTPQVCNGQPSYCSRIYSNVTFIGAHDSGFYGPLLDPRVNQDVNITGQLNAGIRMAEAQTHVLNGELSLCHTSCLELYAGPLAGYLSSIKLWLDGNPNEVFTLLLANGDRVNASMFADVFEQTGLDRYAYVPPTSPNMLPINDWPTYSELIESGKRLVMFLDYDADETVVPYILDEFQYFFETPYDTTDPTFPECTLNRPPNGSAEGRMYLVNHFLDVDLLDTGIDIPDNGADYQTNAATGNGSIGAQVDLCVEMWGYEPTFVLVDFFDRGQVFVAQDDINGVSGNASSKA